LIFSLNKPFHFEKSPEARPEQHEMHFYKYLTSVEGVNQRREKLESEVKSEPLAFVTNAVSEIFISAAIFCLRLSEMSSSSKQTAAGFPVKGELVKASTV